MRGRGRQGDEGEVLGIQEVLGLGLCLGSLDQGGLLWVAGSEVRTDREKPWRVSGLGVLSGRSASSGERAVSALGRLRESEYH